MTTPVRDALPDGVPALTGDVLAIRGGRPLRGRVDVKGAKNLATKAMVASLLGETVSTLRDVPAISDVAVVRSLLEVHGVRVEEGSEPGSLRFDPSDVESAHFEEIDAHAGASRIPILFCGPLLHRLGEAFIPDLGGCRIGDRPIDFHLDALRAFGATVEKLKQAEEAEAARKRGEEERVARAKADNCNRAKQAKVTLDSGRMLANINAKGERGFMDEATRAAETKRANDVIASDCGPAPAAK